MVSHQRGFPGGSESKASACNVGDPGLTPQVGKIPWRRKWQATPVLLPGKFHGRRSLVSYSHGITESHTTELLHIRNSGLKSQVQGLCMAYPM